MNRISAKMKLLSLAVLGLGGMALAGSAAAACPTSPVPPWSAQSVLAGSLAISAGGLDGSDCKLDAKIIANAPGSAFVRDDSPNDEATYRARFQVDASALGTIGGIESFVIYSATTTAPALGIQNLVSLSIVGNLMGTQTFIQAMTPCEGQPGNLCANSIAIDRTQAHTVEIQWVKGSPGSFSLWVDNNDSSSPDWTTAASNSSWGGVDFAALGVALPTVGFRTNHLNQVVSFDSFDSRRTSFIGTP